MPAFEMNIRLDIRGRRNSIADCTQRAQQALDILHEAFGNQRVQARREDIQVEDERLDQLNLDQNLVVRLNVPTTIYAVRVGQEIAEALEQDAVAIYLPGQRHGVLVGPNAHAWGEFDLGKFIRFDNELATLVAAAKAMGKIEFITVK